MKNMILIVGVGAGALVAELVRLEAIGGRPSGPSLPGERGRPGGPSLPGVVALANEDETTGVVGLDNEFSVGADGWLKIAPYGESIKERTVRDKNGTREEVFVQRLDRTAAEAMVKKFNSLTGRIKRFVLGVPIYKRHPDLTRHSPGVVSEALANDETEQGMFADLQAREDGFYGRPVMSIGGKRAIENEGLKFISPFWWARTIGQTENGYPIMSPFELISAGLTDRPNIRGGEALANSANQEKETRMKEKLLALLKRFGVALANEASDDAITAEVEKLGQKASAATALENEKSTLTTAKTTAETALQSEKTARENAERERNEAKTALANERAKRVELLVDNAVREGRITPAEKVQWTQRLNANFDTEVAALANEKQKLNTTSRTGNLGSRNSVTQNTRTVQEQVIALANERVATAKCSWDDAWKWVQAEKPELFKKLEEAPEQS